MISIDSGFGGGPWSGLGTSVDLSSNESRRFCDILVTFLVTCSLERTSGFSRTAAGAASAKLIMESIRRIRVSMLCCRIFVG